MPGATVFFSQLAETEWPAGGGTLRLQTNLGAQAAPEERAQSSCVVSNSMPEGDQVIRGAGLGSDSITYHGDVPFPYPWRNPAWLIDPRSSCASRSTQPGVCVECSAELSVPTVSRPKPASQSSVTIVSVRKVRSMLHASSEPDTEMFLSRSAIGLM